MSEAESQQADRTMYLTEIPSWVYGLFPEAPIGFVREPDRLLGPWCYHSIAPRRMLSMFVICTARVEQDGLRWLHVSCSRRDRLPDWADLRLIKHTFIGDDRVALQVLPREHDYVNIAPRCMHLWSCLDGEPVPDFRVHGQI
jgi:hypothetical protein